VAGEGVLLEILHLAVVHAIEVVVGGIVLAHVFHAEEVILAVLAAAARGAMVARFLAAFPLATAVPLLARRLGASAL
jgi:hypothetical protein